MFHTNAFHFNKTRWLLKSKYSFSHFVFTIICLIMQLMLSYREIKKRVNVCLSLHANVNVEAIFQISIGSKPSNMKAKWVLEDQVT